MTQTCDQVPLATTRGWLTHLRLCLFVSAIYVWAYFATVHLVVPMQQVIFPATVMSLLFLPHGLRVLTAWIYGWRSVAYLAPGAVLCNLHFAGPRAFDADILLGTTASLVSAPLAIALLRLAKRRVGVPLGQTPLSTVLETGVVASFLNLSALGLAYGLVPTESVVIFAGDMSGLLVALLLVRGILRLLPRRT